MSTKFSKLPVKEYVQDSKFDDILLPADSKENFFTTSIPQDLPHMAVAQGYAYPHFGAVRLAITFHGRKGFEAVAQLALLDTQVKEYQQACLGIVQTTLNVGIVFVTLYPNFNIPLTN